MWPIVFKESNDFRDPGNTRSRIAVPGGHPIQHTPLREVVELLIVELVHLVHVPLFHIVAELPDEVDHDFRDAVPSLRPDLADGHASKFRAAGWQPAASVVLVLREHSDAENWDVVPFF